MPLLCSDSFIVGTDTSVGKTHVTVKLIQKWQKTHSVYAMKPVASGGIIQADGCWMNDDVYKLSQATGQIDLALLNPYRLVMPVSPHIAAKVENVDIQLSTIMNGYRLLKQQADYVLIESAGGWFSPLTDRLFMADLAKAFNFPVILVVGMRLGCINHALLTAKAIRDSGLMLAGWVANRIDPEQLCYEENKATLINHIPEPLIFECPYEPDGICR